MARVKNSTLYAEQMDAEGLGRKLLLNPSGDSCRAPEKQTVGTVTASHKMLTLQALSSSLNADNAKRGLPGPRRGFWVPSGSLSPKNGRVHLHIIETQLFFSNFSGTTGLESPTAILFISCEACSDSIAKLFLCLFCLFF